MALRVWIRMNHNRIHIIFLLLYFIFLPSLTCDVAGKEASAPKINPYSLQDGDIVFQSGKSKQAKAVQIATGSKWSHVGIIFFYQGEPWVLEAVQPVKSTRLNEFIARSDSFYAMRLKKAKRYITQKSLKKAETYGKKQLGKKYDPYFQWDNDRLYCSELVWKIYKYATGIELCKPRTLGSYHLDDPAIKKLIKNQYNSMKNLPLDELCVAPSDLAQSPLLTEVPFKSQQTTQR